MREGLRQYLIANVPSVGGRVLDQGAAATDTPKPFLILREVQERPETDWGDLQILIELWPFAARTKFSNLDRLVDEIVTALHNRSFTDGADTFFVEYLESSDDDLEAPEWQAISRGLRFSLYNTAFLSNATYFPDPVAALAAWTAAQFPEVQTDPASWSPSNAQPGIYWRFAGIGLRQLVNWGVWLIAELRAHVMAPSPVVRTTYIRKLVEALGLARQIDLLDGSFLYVETITADPNERATLAGQVRLQAFYGLLGDAPLPDVPLLNFPTVTVGAIADDRTGELF